MPQERLHNVPSNTKHSLRHRPLHSYLDTDVGKIPRFAGSKRKACNQAWICKKMGIVITGLFFGQFYGGQLRLVASEAWVFFYQDPWVFWEMLEFIWKIPEFFFTTSLILGGLSSYNTFIHYWIFFPPCNCQLIPSALGNVYLLKSLALSFFIWSLKKCRHIEFFSKKWPWVFLEVEFFWKCPKNKPL